MTSKAKIKEMIEQAEQHQILVRSMYGNVNIAITEQEYNLLKEWVNNDI